jgi:cell wall-associated NlpC family hydrolase
VWGQSVKQRGCDCKGLVAGVAREIGRPEAASVHALASDYRQVDPRRLRAGMAEVFDRAGVIGAGDVLLLKVAGSAQHLAIVDRRDTWCIAMPRDRAW